MSPMNRLSELKENRKLDNKGFSLVELIIVIAIMAVLIGVLAPQYLRYVEKSRYQTDATMIDNVKNAVEIAISSSEQVYTTMADTTISFSNSALTTIGWTELDNEVKQTIDYGDTKLTSKTMLAATGSNAHRIVITAATGKVEVILPSAP